jgi:hypothetical protein
MMPVFHFSLVTRLLFQLGFALYPLFVGPQSAQRGRLQHLHSIPRYLLVRDHFLSQIKQVLTADEI